MTWRGGERDESLTFVTIVILAFTNIGPIQTCGTMETISTGSGTAFRVFIITLCSRISVVTSTMHKASRSSIFQTQQHLVGTTLVVMYTMLTGSVIVAGEGTIRPYIFLGIFTMAASKSRRTSTRMTRRIMNHLLTYTIIDTKDMFIA